MAQYGVSETKKLCKLSSLDDFDTWDIKHHFSTIIWFKTALDVGQTKQSSQGTIVVRNIGVQLPDYHETGCFFPCILG